MRKKTAVLEEEGATRVACGKGVVRDHDDRGAICVEGLEALEQAAGVLGVERSGGLVGEHQRRVGHNGARRRHALLLATGHLVRELVEHLCDAQALGDLLHATRHLAGRGVVDREGQCDVLARSQGVEQVGVLEDKAQTLATKLRKLMRTQGRDVLTVHENVARGGAVDR